MSILNISGLKKILGTQEIMRGAELRIERGEKMGCVGRNGEGKTTLLRLIEGEEIPDAGSITLSRGCRLAYVTQRPEFAPGVTARAYVESGLDEIHRLEKELEQAGIDMGTAEGDALDALLKRHGEMSERMEFLGGWEADRKVETVMSGIGLREELWDREARTLSGGEKSRTALSRELISVPDLLLLDEPTNHLDLAGIEWIEDYIKQMGSAVFMVSHDRRLLDRVVDCIVELQFGQLTRYPGNYSKYVALKDERYQVEYNAWSQQQDMIRREDNFIKKHMGSQRTAEAKGRRKKLDNIVRLVQPFNDVRKPQIKMGAVGRGGLQVLDADDLKVGYGDNVLFDGAELRIGRHDRIGLVGPNGMGKTTMLKVLAGRLAPLGGEIRTGYKATCGYYDQETSDLRDDGTPYTEIRRDHPQLTDLEIRNHLARFLFRGKDIDLSVGSLSGGERARLSIARLVLSGPSWLALDEPTNHLDLAGRTALEEMLSEFDGALMCVSHDRAFLDSLVTRIIEIKDGGMRSFKGNYAAYKAIIDEEQSAQRDAKAVKLQKVKQQQAEPQQKSKKGSKGSKSPKGSTKQRAPKQKAKAHNPWRIEELEKRIIELEGERDELLKAMGEETTFKDSDKLRDVQMRLAEVERDLGETTSEWEQYAG